MWNIEFKGKLEGDIEQISSDKPLPEGSVMFKEPETSDKAFVMGTLIASPLLLTMFIAGIVRVILVYRGLRGIKFGYGIAAFMIAMVAAYVSQYIHEYIHAFAMPKAVKKQIYVMPQNQMLFVYIEESVPKRQFLISVLAPAVILGIIPYIIWIISTPILPIYVSIGMVMYSFIMTVCAIGDYLNAFNCIRQVPKGAKVFNRGWHSYWVDETVKEKE